MNPATDKLNDHHRQQLSAMLDGELRPDQAKFMLRRLEHDRDLAACWERWQVCGDIMRGRHEALLPADFSRRVAAAIAGQDREAVAQSAAAAPARQPRWARWGGGAALAASVAMAALFVGRQPVESEGESAPAPVQVAASAEAQRTLVATGADASPAPAQPLPDAATTLAAAVAVAEVPRRAAERRSSRTQQQRAGTRARQQAQAPRLVAAASAGEAPAASAPTPAGAQAMAADPRFASSDAVVTELFTAQAPAPRPWPRAVVPGFPGRGAFSASYGADENPFHPFEPRVDLHTKADQPSPPTGPR